MTSSVLGTKKTDVAERAGVDSHALDTLFRHARTHRQWQSEPVPPALLRQLYTLAALGPTSANCCPARLVFVQSDAAKARLLPLVDESNRASTSAAPVTALIAYDLQFFEHLAQLYPHQPDAVSWFSGSPAATRRAALQNSSLQGGYFIMAARALGLDCGPMGGFDGPAIAREFFPDKPYEVNFLCNLGYGISDDGYQRLPRLDFDDACAVM